MDSIPNVNILDRGNGITDQAGYTFILWGQYGVASRAVVLENNFLEHYVPTPELHTSEIELSIVLSGLNSYCN